LFYQTLGAADVQPVIYWTSVPYALHVAAFFACAAWYQSLKLDRFLNLQVALAIAMLMQLVSGQNALNQLLMLLGLPYIILTLGNARNAVFASSERWGDTSYGIYLYAFPIQQCIILWLGRDVSPIVIVAAALPLTIGLSLFSWHAVEKHALKWKPRLNLSQPPGTAIRSRGPRTVDPGPSSPGAAATGKSELGNSFAAKAKIKG
jgi:peptidoglycan/LPS O-acetylase OafA/YrhL